MRKPVPLVPPQDADQAAREQEFQQRLAKAEAETVLSMAADAVPLSEIAANAAWFAEAMTQKHRHPQSPPVACKAGCSWCCTQAVAVTAAEAIRVARHLDQNPQLKANLVPRLKALDARTRGLTPVQRALLREPCAFLQDGKCGIYEVRPLACAEFTSYDVEACKREHASGWQGKMVHERARRLTHLAVYEGLAAGLARALPKADGAQLELMAAVLGFLEDPALEKDWASGARDLAPCHLRSG